MATQPARQLGGHDPTQVDSGHYTVELEDEKIRVVRIKYGPGEKSVMHGHPALVGVMLTDTYIRFHYPNGSDEIIRAKAGDVMNLPATEHLPENLSDQTFEAIIVEFKS